MWHYVTRQVISNISNNHSDLILKVKLSWTVCPADEGTSQCQELPVQINGITSHNTQINGITSHNTQINGITSHNTQINGITSHNTQIFRFNYGLNLYPTEVGISILEHSL
jgi:hypothetical protein